jgi:hypothetical protein
MWFGGIRRRIRRHAGRIFAVDASAIDASAANPCAGNTPEPLSNIGFRGQSLVLYTGKPERCLLLASCRWKNRLLNNPDAALAGY